MPYNKAPDRIKGLPSHAKDIWISAFNSAYKQYKGNEEKSNAVAWAAVKKAGYKKTEKGWVKASENFYYISLSEAENLPNQIEIMRTGKWKHPVYENLEITGNTIDCIIKNFEDNVRGVDISFDLEHGETNHKSEAVCWVKKLIKKGSSLLAEIDWTDFGKEKVKSKSFRYFSPEFKFTYTDAETGKTYNNVLFGGALTNRPFIKHMSPIMLSEEINSIDLNSDLYSPCIKDNEKGDNGMNKKLLEALKLSETSTELEIETAVNKMIEDSKKLSEISAENETLKAEKKTLEDEKKTLEADKTALTTKLNEAIGSKSTAEQEIVKLNESIKNINLKFTEADWTNVYTTALNEGRMTPAMGEVFKKQFIADPESTREMIKVLPVVVNLGENGSSNSNADDKSYVKLFEAETAKVMKESKLPYDEAILVVAKEQPELAKNSHMERKGLI
jgi:phage I-like protein/cation transport regulator ChaB